MTIEKVAYRRKKQVMAAGSAASPGRKQDRRVAYTKLSLRNALIELMQSQHISGITVKSICMLADINRGTFYLHYSDQYDLLHQIEQEVLTDISLNLKEATDTGSITLSAMTKILEYARDNASLARVLLSENCDFAFKQDIMELTQLVNFIPDKNVDKKMKDYIVTYGINGCVALAEKWLQSGMTEEPEEFAELILQVLNFGISGFVSADNHAKLI